ncbi:hypothetical protein [Actinopolyspora mortivallis]|uniref:Uncharacterized protein n=1 Tax=Actinopolyspora mortivallis TaxID=33906 RepID=A0A2T0H0V8_ACTMO|nr:hypothetical protein [Actinopolyspora mortivallis]PRW65005.1 hypothetical protein CEP50_00225 [Actinopolyspora mortivallis]
MQDENGEHDPLGGARRLAGELRGLLGELARRLEEFLLELNHAEASGRDTAGQSRRNPAAEDRRCPGCPLCDVLAASWSRGGSSGELVDRFAELLGTLREVVRTTAVRREDTNRTGQDPAAEHPEAEGAASEHHRPHSPTGGVSPITVRRVRGNVLDEPGPTTTAR